jgi:hypothetical protein
MAGAVFPDPLMRGAVAPDVRRPKSKRVRGLLKTSARPPMAEPAQSADVEIRCAGDVFVIEPLSPAVEAWLDRTVPNRPPVAVRVPLRWACYNPASGARQ